MNELQIMLDRMINDEKSEHTIQKYLKDAEEFIDYLGEESISKNKVLVYKHLLATKYMLSSVNTKIAAINYYLKSIGLEECQVCQYKVQRRSFRDNQRELSIREYHLLIDVAKETNKRLYLIMLTICATGIRISELQFITVESAISGSAIVFGKKKGRKILLPDRLCEVLLQYAADCGIDSGSIFITRNGHVVDRSNVARDMKMLCKHAGVEESKVFPHNLRHLFAVSYYNEEKDIVHLADLMGHSSLNTTRIYTNISIEEQKRKLNKMTFWEG